MAHLNGSKWLRDLTEAKKINFFFYHRKGSFLFQEKKTQLFFRYQPEKTYLFFPNSKSVKTFPIC